MDSFIRNKQMQRTSPKEEDITAKESYKSGLISFELPSHLLSTRDHKFCILSLITNHGNIQLQYFNFTSIGSNVFRISAIFFFDSLHMTVLSPST
jgi:hypothetical protein